MPRPFLILDGKGLISSGPPQLDQFGDVVHGAMHEIAPSGGVRNST